MVLSESGGAGIHDDGWYEQASREVLDHALAQVRAYQEWRPYDPGPHVQVDKRYACLPVLTKHHMRTHGPAAFHSPGLDYDGALQRGDIELVDTSGTTGEQVRNVWYQPWWDASERESWALNSFAGRAATGTHREAILTGPRQTGRLCEHGTLSMHERTLGRFLYLNEKPTPDAWTPALMTRMLDELEAFAPAVLEANPSLAAKLARYATTTGRQPFQPGLIALTYENPSNLHRRDIARAFRCPVASSFGSTEAGYVFMECESGSLHQVAHSCRVDFQPLRAEHGGADIGRIFVTTFGNPWRVLLRFDIGDLVRVQRQPCPCGRREGLTLESIEGRTQNMTFTADGRAVAPGTIDRAVSRVEGVAEYQLTQHSRRRHEVLIVPDGGRAGAGLVQDVGGALATVFGEGAVFTIKLVASFPPEVSGKYRLVRPLIEFDVDSLFVVQAG